MRASWVSVDQRRKVFLLQMQTAASRNSQYRRSLEKMRASTTAIEHMWYQFAPSEQRCVRMTGQYAELSRYPKPHADDRRWSISLSIWSRVAKNSSHDARRLYGKKPIAVLTRNQLHAATGWILAAVVACSRQPGWRCSPSAVALVMSRSGCMGSVMQSGRGSQVGLLGTWACSG